MAILRVFASLGRGFDMSSDFRVADFRDTALVSANPNRWVVDFRLVGASSVTLTLDGTGLPAGGSFSAGTLTGMSEANAGAVTHSLTGMSLSVAGYVALAAAGDEGGFVSAVFAGADTLLGAGYDDALEGGAGDDRIDTGAGYDVAIGDEGNDVILTGADGDVAQGGEGNDTIEGGADGDLLDGGAGYDVLSYAGATAGVAVSLRSGLGFAGDANGDLISDFESLLGSPFGDVLVGSDDHNIIEGGAGADLIDGLLGNDWLSYEHAASGIAINLAVVGAAGGWVGDAAGDTVTGIENLRGSAFGDGLYGDDGANILRGDAGPDTLYGGGNSDTIYYSTSTVPVVVDLSANAASGGDADGDVLVSVENVFATPYADVLIGDSASNTLVGWYGVDVLTGNGSNDIFRWTSVFDSGVAAGSRDIVTDFWTDHGDLLDVSGIDADAGVAGDQAFAFIGWAAFSAAGQLRFGFDGLGNTVVELNLDAGLAADMAIQLTGTKFLAASDFVL